MNAEEAKVAALKICRKEKFIYLSHEFYPGHCYPLWIVVEDEFRERFEIKRMFSEAGD